MTSHTDASLCAHGCYWECEHRIASGESGLSAVTHAPMPVHDGEGRPLQRCRTCGGAFYSAAAHALEHERLRLLGLLPERFPKRWPAIVHRAG